GAIPRAHVAQDHEGGGLVLPALADIGAARLLTDRVKPELAHHPADPGIVLAAGRLHREPIRLSGCGRRHGRPGRRVGRRGETGELYQRCGHGTISGQEELVDRTSKNSRAPSPKLPDGARFKTVDSCPTGASQKNSISPVAMPMDSLARVAGSASRLRASVASPTTRSEGVGRK